MKNSSFKALYVFLSSLLGILMFGLLHRALFVIYDLLGDFYPGIAFFSAERYVIQTVDFFSLLFFVFLGGWYGVWLGFHWFHVVYEDENFNKVFHGFIPKFSKNRKVKDVTRPSEVKTGLPKKIVVSSKPSRSSFQTMRASSSEPATWNLEDLAPTTSSVAKKTRVVKKVAKKVVAKKRTTKAVSRKKVLQEVS